MKNLVYLIFIFIFSCGLQKNENPSRFRSVEEMLSWVKRPTDDYKMVVAHRGYWRSAPENSLLAVQNAVKEGIDIVEIDVRKTFDNHLIVMHDYTLDRTTTGRGIIAELTLDSIKKVYLKNGVGAPTHHPVPTLKEMMQYIAGQNLLVNLDKCWEYLPEAYQVLKETNTLDHVLFKGSEPLSVLREKHGNLIDSINYMPMVWPQNYNIYTNNVSEEPISYVDDFLQHFNPIGFEVIYDREESPVISTIQEIKDDGVAVWVNTLWPELCAGHSDEFAYEDPDKHWGWVIANGANIIQSDRPVFLISYLKSKNLR